MYITKYYFMSLLHFYIKTFSMFLESIFGMCISISIKIDAQSASSISKLKKRNMFVNFTHSSRQILIWIIIMVSQMFNVIFCVDYIFTYLTTIFSFLAIITTFFPRLIFTLITHHFFTFEKLFFPKFCLVKYTMSHSTNSNVTSVNFCDVCNLSFETKKGLYRHQSYDPKHKKLLEKVFDSNLDEDITES